MHLRVLICGLLVFVVLVFYFVFTELFSCLELFWIVL